MPAAAWLEKLKHHPSYFKEGKWKPFATSYAYIYGGMFKLLLLKGCESLLRSILFPSFLTFHVHQNPESTKCELNSLSGKRRWEI